MAIDVRSDVPNVSPTTNTFVSNQEIILEARKNLEQDIWDYLVGGSESETTMRRNRLAFDCLAFRPRVLVDVSKIDTSTTLLGHPLRMPVILAPVGGLQRYTPEGAAASTRAAAEFGTVHAVSSVSGPSLEETAAASAAPRIFQLYIHGDWDWVKGMIRRAKDAGYMALCITVDNAVHSHRERVILGYSTQPEREGRDQTTTASVTWDMVDRIKEEAGLPFILKGIATAEDAELAIQHGVNVVWVSNHGGRQLDHSRGTIETLPEIVQAVGGRAEIVLDGGIQRGSDVVKAVSLGARAVAIGKLQGWGLGAAGQAGVMRVLELLEAEIGIAMRLLGVTSLDQLGPNYLSPAMPVMLPHEMSQFSHLPNGPVR
jgi:isopentenyl diphosphate isomerase/L-lactate dehydrogenase-like FMN-dependent dehydrogenase